MMHQALKTRQIFHMNKVNIIFCFYHSPISDDGNFNYLIIDYPSLLSSRTVENVC